MPGSPPIEMSIEPLSEVEPSKKELIEEISTVPTELRVGEQPETTAALSD